MNVARMMEKPTSIMDIMKVFSTKMVDSSKEVDSINAVPVYNENVNKGEQIRLHQDVKLPAGPMKTGSAVDG